METAISNIHFQFTFCQSMHCPLGHSVANKLSYSIYCTSLSSEFYIRHVQLNNYMALLYIACLWFISTSSSCFRHWHCNKGNESWGRRPMSHHNTHNKKGKHLAKFLECIGLNTMRPRQNGRHFPDDIFKWIFVNKNVWVSINISLKFVPRVKLTILQHWFR